MKFLLFMILLNYSCYCQSSVWTNVAYGKMASNSSAVVYFDGFLTIDGQLEPPYCFSSLSSGYQWLQIDLIWIYRVDVVQIIRKLLTILPERANLLLLKNAYSLDAYPATNRVTNVNVQLVAALAVDGIRDTYLGHSYCAHTNEAGFLQNWFQVDMGKECRVDYIAFISRFASDPLVVNRLNNFIIGLTQFNVSSVMPVRGKYPLCNTYPGTVPPATRVIVQCNPNLPAYRYLIAQQAVGASDGWFFTCELEAYEPMNVNDPIKQLKWKSYVNQRLVNYTFLAFSAPRPILCIIKCIKLGSYAWDSFNFNTQLEICELNQHRNGFQIANMKVNLTWSFWNATYYYVGNI